MNHASRQRIRVLALRVRLERIAAEAFDRICNPETRGEQGNIRARLTFVLAGVPQEDFAAAHHTVQLARHVYAKTSQVMHGHLGLIDLPDVLVEEWRKVVDDLQALTDRAQRSADRVAVANE
jgi:hypothetical protein